MAQPALVKVGRTFLYGSRGLGYKDEKWAIVWKACGKWVRRRGWSARLRCKRRKSNRVTALWFTSVCVAWQKVGKVSTRTSEEGLMRLVAGLVLWTRCWDRVCGTRYFKEWHLGVEDRLGSGRNWTAVEVWQSLGQPRGRSWKRNVRRSDHICCQMAGPFDIPVTCIQWPYISCPIRVWPQVTWFSAAEAPWMELTAAHCLLTTFSAAGPKSLLEGIGSTYHCLYHTSPP